MHELGILDPISVVDYLFNEVGVDIPEPMVTSYWNHYRGPRVSAKWAVRHPARSDAIPIGLYGDACKIRQGEKMVGIYMNLPMYRPRSIRCSRFLLTAVQEELMYKRKTLDCIWRFVVWRVNLLLEGKYPSCDINGRLLQGPEMLRAGREVVAGKTFALTELRGDWVWLKDCLSFRSSWKGGTTYPVCFKCEARAREPHLYYNVQRNSDVWNTEYTNVADFLASQMPNNPSFLAEKNICFVFNQMTLYPKLSGIYDWYIYIYCYIVSVETLGRLWIYELIYFCFTLLWDNGNLWFRTCSFPSFPIRSVAVRPSYCASGLRPGGYSVVFDACDQSGFTIWNKCEHVDPCQ